MSFFCGGKFSGLNDGDDNIIDYLQNVKWYGYSLEPKKKKREGGEGRGAKIRNCLNKSCTKPC